MKRFLLAAAVLLPTMGAQAETLWVGNAFVTAAPTACGTSAKIGDFWRAIYRPAGTGLGNGANSYLSLTSSRANIAMTVPGTVFQVGTNYGARSVGSTVSLASYGGAVQLWQESNAFAGVPVNASVTARLTKFFGTANCTATLRMHFTKLP